MGFDIIANHQRSPITLSHCATSSILEPPDIYQNGGSTPSSKTTTISTILKDLRSLPPPPPLLLPLVPLIEQLQISENRCSKCFQPSFSEWKMNRVLIKVVWAVHIYMWISSNVPHSHTWMASCLAMASKFHPQWSGYWIVSKFHKGIDYVHICAHNCTCNLDYISNYLDLRVSNEERERSHQEKSGKESRFRGLQAKII